MKSARNTLGKFSTAVASAATGAITFGAAMATAAAAGLALLTKESLSSIDATAKLSDRLNTTTEGLIGLHHAAELSGSSADKMNDALKDMNLNLGRAISGVQGNIDAFEALGLSVDDLSKMSADEAFKAIADGLQGIENPSQRAAASMAIFGEAGVELMNTLNAGGDGIAAMQQEAEDLGLTFSRLDAANVEKANDAMDKMWKSVKGLGNQLAIQLAPFITKVADEITAMSTTWLNWKDVVSSTLTVSSRVIGFFLNQLHTVSIGVQGLVVFTGAMLDGVMEGFTRMVEGVEMVVNATSRFTGVTMDISKGLRRTTDALHENVKAQTLMMRDSALKPWGNSFVSTVDRITEESQDTTGAIGDTTTAVDELATSLESLEGLKPFEDMMHNLEESLNTFGLTQDAIERLKLSQNENVTPEMLAQVEEYQNQLRDLENITAFDEQKKALEEQIKTFGMSADELERYKLSQNNMVAPELLEEYKNLQDELKGLQEEQSKIEEGKKVWEDNLTNMEKYEREIERLAELRKGGFIKDDETFKRAIESAKETYSVAEGPQEDSQPKFASAMTLGSTEARNTILSYMGQGRQADPMTEMKKLSEEQLNETKEQNRILTEILNNSGQGDIIPFVT